jgi:hypothetical protein
MSERFGVPDHAPRHDEAPQGTTPQGSWANIGGGDDGGWPAPTAPASGGRVRHGRPIQITDRPKSVPVAVVLAVLFGPLGLFFVGFLHGLVALFVVVPTARTIGLIIVDALGGRIDRLLAAVLVMWSITVPWAILGTAWRNRRFNR